MGLIAIVSLPTQVFWVTRNQYVPLVVILSDELVAPVLQRNAALVEVSLSRMDVPVQRMVSWPRFTTGGAY